MKRIILFATLIISITANSQVSKVYLQASGLTCSICSNAISKSLKTLDFVDKVDANLSDYIFEITFTANGSVEFDKLRKKVEDAGFFVSGFTAVINFNNAQLKENQPLLIGSNRILFVDEKDRSLNGEVKVTLIDKGFISSKEYRKKGYSKYLPEAGIYNATI